MKNKIIQFSVITFLLFVLGVVPVLAQKTRAEQILEKIKKPSKDYVLVVSHRGDWRYAPENSLAAIQHCIDMGVDIVELDFRMTKDGHLITMHDKTVDRTTNGKGKISDFTLAEIKELRLKNNGGVRYSRQQVPTLEEVMLLCKGKIMVNLDKTEGETVLEAYEILKKTGTVSQGVFKGNDSYRSMKEKCGNVMDSIIYFPKLWDDTPNHEDFVAEYKSKYAPIGWEMLFDAEDSFVCDEIKKLNTEGVTVQACALWDELVAGHTDEKSMMENPDVAWGWLIEHGANAVMTDRTAELIQYLEKKNLRNL